MTQADIALAVKVRCEEVQRLLSELRKLYTVQNAAQPVNHLPNDVLAAIMQQYRIDNRFCDDVGRRKAERFPHEWLKLGAICRQWRAVFLGYPLLWSDITLTTPTVLEFMLTRSADAPINVISAPGDWKARGQCYAMLLRKAAHRIRRLEILLPPDLHVTSSGMVRELQESATWNMPLLESIHINAFYGLEVDLVQRVCDSLVLCPLLRHVDIQCASWSVASAGIRPTLKTLRMRNMYSKLSSVDWIDVLRTTPDLDTLDLVNTVCDPDEALSRALVERVSLPKLRYLRLSVNTTTTSESSANLLDCLTLRPGTSIVINVQSDVDCRRLCARTVHSGCGQDCIDHTGVDSVCLGESAVLSDLPNRSCDPSSFKLQDDGV